LSLSQEELEARKRETLRELASVFRELRAEFVRALEEKKRYST